MHMQVAECFSLLIFDAQYAFSHRDLNSSILNIFFYTVDKMAEDTWTLILQLGGPTPEHESVQKEMDKDFICFFNIVDLVEKYNYSSIDYIYYKRREDSGTATLVGIENDDDVRRMLIEHESENKVRLCVMKEKACMDNRVSITAVKSSREIARAESNGPKEACTVIFRNETLKTYKNSQARAEILNALRNRREQEMGPCSLSNVGSEQHSDNPGILDTNNTNPQTDWPTHARRCRTQLEDMDQARKKGRGTLKGYKVAKKRFDNASQKLPIEFSTRLGGPIGINYRSFIEEVVLFMKRKAPIIGVRKWKDIHDDVKNSIAIDVLAKWDLADTRSTRKKIWDIARERYRGWRSNLHATYQAYNNDGLRFKNKPEDLDILEWEYLIHYFGTDKKFQEISQKNSENRKKQKTQHVTGAKSFSQTSYEKRDKETGEEPNMLDLWKATHMKDDKWSNTAAKDVYENAHKKIADREEKIGNPVSVEEQNNVFQESYRASTNCKTSQARGQGYMAKAVTGPESLHAQIDEQAHVTAETQRKNNELFCEVSELKAKLAAQQEESDRKLEAERNERLRLELKIQEEQCKERQVLREEMIAMLMGQTAPSTEQSDPSVQVPSENAELHDKTKKARSIENSAVMRALFHQNTINQGTTSNNTQRTISSHDLRKAAKNYGRSRTDQDKII